METSPSGHAVADVAVSVTTALACAKAPTMIITWVSRGSPDMPAGHSTLAIDVLAAAAGRSLPNVHRINDVALGRACLTVSRDVSLMSPCFATASSECSGGCDHWASDL